MMKLAFCLLAAAIMLATATIAPAVNLPEGYGDTKWGTHFHKVMESYPKGQIGEYNKDIIYTQENPDETIATRIFAFKEGKLTSVAVTFSAKYVRKSGLENLRLRYMKQYGKGKTTGNSSHMVSYAWEGKHTRVTFIYVPNRLDMTVIQYEKK
jgi:hypothetical protein